MQLIWIVSLFFAVLIALFAVQNTTPVSVNLLPGWRLDAVAVSTLVLAAAALGALLTYLFGLARGIKGRMTLRANRATIRDQEALIADLRAQIRDLERENESYRRVEQSAPPAGDLEVGGRRREGTEPTSRGDAAADELAPARPNPIANPAPDPQPPAADPRA